jgi:hypothetical protein
MHEVRTWSFRKLSFSVCNIYGSNGEIVMQLINTVLKNLDPIYACKVKLSLP